ncbi:WhiB family transcriptional regulator [Candidatus Saccharibacteria bacterium]|nr:WhiB family transcriptional regulator [Candidatus Saccharibacteria bacterium]
MSPNRIPRGDYYLETNPNGEIKPDSSQVSIGNSDRRLGEFALGLGLWAFEEWRAYAACAGLNPDIFFPTTDYDIEVAKAICADCGVSQECLNYSQERPEVYGIWGGKNKAERRALRHRESGHPPEKLVV